MVPRIIMAYAGPDLGHTLNFFLYQEVVLIVVHCVAMVVVVSKFRPDPFSISNLKAIVKAVVAIDCFKTVCVFIYWKWLFSPGFFTQWFNSITTIKGQLCAFLVIHVTLDVLQSIATVFSLHIAGYARERLHPKGKESPSTTPKVGRQKSRATHAFIQSASGISDGQDFGSPVSDHGLYGGGMDRYGSRPTQYTAQNLSAEYGDYQTPRDDDLPSPQGPADLGGAGIFDLFVVWCTVVMDGFLLRHLFMDVPLEIRTPAPSTRIPAPGELQVPPAPQASPESDEDKRVRKVYENTKDFTTRLYDTWVPGRYAQGLAWMKKLFVGFIMAAVVAGVIFKIVKKSHHNS